MFTQTEQYFTSLINILEYNEKIRQKYEVAGLNNDQGKEMSMKEIREIIVEIKETIGSKSEFLGFLGSEKGRKVLLREYDSDYSNNKKPKQNYSTDINPR